MPARRRPAAALGAVAALVLLSGCERPTPLVTLYASGKSINDRAFSFCFEGQDPAAAPGTAGACRYDVGGGRLPELLRVEPGDEVLVDVAKDLADAGWQVVLREAGGQASRLATQKEHTTRFQPDFNRSDVITVEVQKLQGTGDGARPVGVWQFTVVPR